MLSTALESLIRFQVWNEEAACLCLAGVLARRGYNIQSLAVGTSEREGMSRIVTVIPVAKNEDTSKIAKQLLKLINVDSVRQCSALNSPAEGIFLAACN